jgi:hypothetical protein
VPRDARAQVMKEPDLDALKAEVGRLQALIDVGRREGDAVTSDIASACVHSPYCVPGRGSGFKGLEWRGRGGGGVEGGEGREGEEEEEEDKLTIKRLQVLFEV